MSQLRAQSFTISIIFDRKKYSYPVKLMSIDSREERYLLRAKNKTVIFTNNRPFLQSKKLKHWKLTWKVDTQLNSSHFQEMLINAIEKVIL